ncbi:ssDNA-binding protein, mitochondrial [Imshaugia aleurites]|uniref:SsDNA-binding protein, mitochondrial n=1 Tax=Imshaugia aleurites TaxID=172621 RepID=A0A8H3EDI3_9LECA|nr:ssDNA-binding protein, mitochondrial [Imshaugia aleurites]
MSFLTSLRPALRSPLLQTPRPFTTSPASRLARMTIVGRLADVPEMVATSSGVDVVRYALATSHGPRENRQTSWWKVACFMPEGAKRDALVGLGKGSLMYVEGECSMNKFQNKEGTPATALSIVQKHFEILDKRDPRAEGQVEGE